MKIEWKQALTPETLELLSGNGTKPLKMIVATVYEWQGGNETDSEEAVRRKNKKGKEKEMQNSMRIQLLDIAESAPRSMQRNKQGTHLQQMAAKLFVHGRNKQETNQLQKSMSAEQFTAIFKTS